MPVASAPPPTAVVHDDYAQLRGALSGLEADSGNAAARATACEVLRRLGLELPAAELTPGDGSKTSGRVPWDQFQAQFAANYAALRRRHPDFEPTEAELQRAIAQLDLFQSNDGNYHLSRRIGRGPRRWLPGIVNWRQIADRPDLVPDTNSLCVPYAIEGVAFGELIANIFAGTRKLLLDYRARIHLFESNLAQLAAWLHVRDLRELFGDERVSLWIGRPGLRAFLAFHAAHPRAVFPPFVISHPGWGAGQHSMAQPAFEAVANAHAAEESHHRAAIGKQTAGRDRAFYACRLANRHAEPIRILGITSRFTTYLQYAMRDIQQTAEARGYQFELLIEPDEFTPRVPNHLKAARIAAFNPDLLVMIDHNRHEYASMFDLAIPYVNWLHDDLSHLFEPGAGKLGPLDIAVGYISQRSARRAGYPPRQCCFAPIPVNPRVYNADGAPRHLLEQARCDISFVSHLSQPAEAFLSQCIAREPRPTVRLLIHALYEEMSARITSGRVPATTPQTSGITQELARRIGLDLTDAQAEAIRRTFTDRLINLIFRHQPLCWAAELGLNLHIYGNGWDAHPQLARFARGPAANGDHLRAIFQASSVNLQIYPQSSFHQRLLEGLFSGGFFLIRGTPCDDVAALYRSVAERCRAANTRDEESLWNAADPQLQADVRRLNDVLIAPRRLYDGFAEQLHDYANWAYELEMASALPNYADVAFRTRADFERQVKRWISNPEERRAIAERQRTHVLERFTYDAFLERVLDFTAKCFAETQPPTECPPPSSSAPSNRQSPV